MIHSNEANTLMLSEIRNTVYSNLDETQNPRKVLLLSTLGTLLVHPNDLSRAEIFPREFLYKHLTDRWGSFTTQLQSEMSSIVHGNRNYNGIERLHVAPVIAEFAENEWSDEIKITLVTHLKSMPSSSRSLLLGTLSDHEKSENVRYLIARHFLGQMANNSDAYHIDVDGDYHFPNQSVIRKLLPQVYRMFGKKLSERDTDLDELVINNIDSGSQLATEGMGKDWYATNGRISTVRFSQGYRRTR